MHYDELFVDNQDLISETTIRMVEIYHQLKADYRKVGKQYTEQKAMYILFIITKNKSVTVKKAIDLLENFINDYANQHSIDTAKSRILIKPTFRQELEKVLVSK